MPLLQDGQGRMSPFNWMHFIEGFGARLSLDMKRGEHGALLQPPYRREPCGVPRALHRTQRDDLDAVRAAASAMLKTKAFGSVDLTIARMLCNPSV